MNGSPRKTSNLFSAKMVPKRKVVVHPSLVLHSFMVEHLGYSVSSGADECSSAINRGSRKILNMIPSGIPIIRVHTTRGTTTRNTISSTEGGQIKGGAKLKTTMKAKTKARRKATQKTPQVRSNREITVFSTSPSVK